MSDVLTDQSVVMCPHGGVATVTSSNTRVRADGGFVLVESDEHVVAGCPFMRGSTSSPCVRVSWTSEQESTAVLGTQVLHDQSVGSCYSGDNALQGLAVKTNARRAKVQ